MNKRRATISVLTVLLLGVGAWALGFVGGNDPALAELQLLSDQMSDRSLPDAQRDQLRTDFQQRMDSLTEAQRRAFFASNRDHWNGRMQQRMDEFFAMPRADQQKRLDEILNRMAQSQKSPQNASRQGNRGGRSMTDAQRDERSKRRLDRTTPKMRAQFAEFRRQLDLRAKQRGMQTNSQGFGGFRGGRGV